VQIYLVSPGGTGSGLCNCIPLPKAHSGGVVQEPAMEISEELDALFKRADLAALNARQLLAENERWRRMVLQQFDHMFEISAEFSRSHVGIKRP
jgi:hypothetical protein